MSRALQTCTKHYQRLTTGIGGYTRHVCDMQRTNVNSKIDVLLFDTISLRVGSLPPLVKLTSAISLTSAGAIRDLRTAANWTPS